MACSLRRGQTLRPFFLRLKYALVVATRALLLIALESLLTHQFAMLLRTLQHLRRLRNSSHVMPLYHAAGTGYSEIGPVN